MRDTVLVPGGGCSEMTICFDAVNPGVWALLSQGEYDAVAGMMTTIEYTA
jgi:FtsP/CotA-like multicopper oxidase with cupredoxin domain